MATDARPKPEQFLHLIRQQQRGRLKIYLGFAAGVGKTYEMLQEGHRLKRQGVDVVLGVVEPGGVAERLRRADERRPSGRVPQRASQPGRPQGEVGMVRKCSASTEATRSTGFSKLTKCSNLARSRTSIATSRRSRRARTEAESDF